MTNAKRTEYMRAWRSQHKEQIRTAQRKRYHENKEKHHAYWQTYKKKHRTRAHFRNLELKLEVLTHYGKNGRLQCSWPDCEVVDPDMLTLDHTNNDGEEHRKEIKSRGGQSTYRWIIKNGFPEDFQTLCWNHQAKKELMRRRDERFGL